MPDVAAAHEPWTPADVTPALADATEDAVQLAAAIMHAEELVRTEPHRADLHRKLGFLLAKQGRSEDAAAEFRRAVECGRRRVQ
jgi:Flp pilus assembly protein TadD